jgi:hypothetical protein
LFTSNPYLINSVGNKKFVGWKPNNAFLSPGSAGSSPSNLLPSLSVNKICLKVGTVFSIQHNASQTLKLLKKLTNLRAMNTVVSFICLSNCFEALIALRSQSETLLMFKSITRIAKSLFSKQAEVTSINIQWTVSFPYQSFAKCAKLPSYKQESTYDSVDSEGTTHVSLHLLSRQSTCAQTIDHFSVCCYNSFTSNSVMYDKRN